MIPEMAFNEESKIKRRRMWGAAGYISESICAHYTEGERAVLNVIAAECNVRGKSELSINQMADRAGVGRTSVHLTVTKARVLGHIRVEFRQELGLANRISIAPDRRQA